MADYIYMMESRLSPEQQRAVALLTETARTHNMNVYLVGGAIRDIISGAMIRDLDFVVQGNALKLQKDLEKSGFIIDGVDETTRTLYFQFATLVRGEVSAAREEKFPKPGKAPEITFSSIQLDLRRRDFTVNAMGLSLNEGSRGLLLDPFNGVADIEAKHLRILHNYALLEEPSRMLRAVRFLARFHWTMEERTQARFEAAKENGYLDHVNDRALAYEFEQVAHEEDPLFILKALDKEGWVKVLHDGFSLAKVDADSLHEVAKLRSQLSDLGYQADTSATHLYFLTRKLGDRETAALQRAIPRKGLVERWKRLEDDAKALAQKLTGKETAQPSQAWQLLSATNPETIIFLDVTTRNSTVRQKIHNFIHKWRQVRAKLPFPEMAEMRITPDLPEYGKVMDEAFLMLLDGKLRSHNEVVKFLTPYSPPEPPPPPPPRRGRAPKKEAAPAPAPAAPPESKADAATGKKSKGAAAAAKSNKGEPPKEARMATKGAGNQGTGIEGMAVNAAKTVGSTLGKVVSAVTKVVGGKKSGKGGAKKSSSKSAAKKGSSTKKSSAKKSSAKKSGGSSKKKSSSRR